MGNHPNLASESGFAVSTRRSKVWIYCGLRSTWRVHLNPPSLLGGTGSAPTPPPARPCTPTASSALLPPMTRSSRHGSTPARPAAWTDRTPGTATAARWLPPPLLWPGIPRPSCPSSTTRCRTSTKRPERKRPAGGAPQKATALQPEP